MGGVTVYGEVEDLTVKDPVFLFQLTSRTSEEVVAALDSYGIRVHNRTSDAYSKHTLKALGIKEAVRVSAAHYNSLAEVDMFLKALGKVSR